MHCGSGVECELLGKQNGSQALVFPQLGAVPGHCHKTVPCFYPGCGCGQCCWCTFFSWFFERHFWSGGFAVVRRLPSCPVSEMCWRNKAAFPCVQNQMIDIPNVSAFYKYLNSHTSIKCKICSWASSICPSFVWLSKYLTSSLFIKCSNKPRQHVTTIHLNDMYFSTYFSFETRLVAFGIGPLRGNALPLITYAPTLSPREDLRLCYLLICLCASACTLNRPWNAHALHLTLNSKWNGLSDQNG